MSICEYIITHKYKNKMSKLAFFMSKDRYFHITGGSSVPEITLESCSFSSLEQWCYRAKAHPFWIFYWNAQDQAVLHTEAQRIPMKKEFCYLIPPYTLFSTENRGRFDHFYCHFTVSGYFECLQRKIHLLPSDLLREKLPLFRKKDPPQKMLFSFKAMLAEYLTRIGEEQFMEKGRSLLDGRIRQAVRLMDENTAAPPDNRELARKAGMSLKTFYEKFSRNMGMTPKRYLLNQRMERARQMLLHSEVTPEEIAESTGYADRFHFSKAFRKFYGISPVSFRKKFSPRGSD